MESLIDKADTGDLLKTLRNCSTKEEMEKYAQECAGTKRPEEIFREKIDDGTVTLQQINARSSGFLRRPYISRVMDGECGNPDRDRIILMGFIFGLGEKELDRTLRAYGRSPLYIKIPRDAIILVCLLSGMHDLWEVNVELERFGLETFRCIEE